MSETIARYYVAEKNPEGAFLPGVPLADLSQEQFDALPEWLQQSVDASPLYRKTKPPTETAPLKRETKE
jgi:hypothetical protein